MSIKPLPGDVVAQIKSSVAITSLNNVICGLVKNALDAKATKINLTVDYSRGNCSIEDDGVGIPPPEFKHTGGLGQLHSSLCDSPDASEWVSIGASAPKLSISGYVCREPVATKRIQFISLGIEPLSNEFRSNVLYEEVNKVFAESNFGAIDDEGNLDEDMKGIKTQGFAQRDLKIRKGVDRWPMFFLKISPVSTSTQRSLEVDDILDDRQPNLVLIVDLLKAMFFEFLRKNLCRARQPALSAKSNPRRYREHDEPSGNVDGVFITSVKLKSELAEAQSLRKVMPTLNR
ncbi:DNA mismatch repair protein [Cytospora paraplurivora]|uniref:DNA mismatch repair protein n=1 Tax=Cytospora paraplurivora TaxID=2898453 RepID=A0AAN9U668_9PEZI